MKIIGLIIVAMLIGGGIYYYDHTKEAQGALSQYQTIIRLPSADQVSAAISATRNWAKDPVNNTPYPKGWQHGPMTVQGKTFNFVTSDPSTPPNYYVSFDYPNTLVPKQNLIRCLPNIDKKAATSVCVIGDNPEINAYFKIVEWLKSNSQMPNSPKVLE